jgi:hypothetical protein
MSLPKEPMKTLANLTVPSLDRASPAPLIFPPEIVKQARAKCGMSNLARDVCTCLLAQVALVFGGEAEAKLAAATWLAEMKPRNVTEAMLSVQMIAVHDAATLFLRRAVDGGSPDLIERNVLQAARLMRVFAEQLQAMRHCKGKSGRQQVTVKHMHVNSGGQAIVGVVKGKR